MSFTWLPEETPVDAPLGMAGWIRAMLRGVVLLVLVVCGLTLLLLIRLVERPLCGLRRPVSPVITVCVCRAALSVLRLRHEVVGQPMRDAGAVVSNHASWLDIFVLNAAKRIYFVSKAEVAGWPGIGALARAVGTVFIARDRTQARVQTALFEARLSVGHMLLFFPEGTSTDGMRVLPFKTTLFQAFFSPDLHASLQIQPVTVIYAAPRGMDARFYGWWGDMEFGGHFLKVLAVRGPGAVKVIYHSPVAVRDWDSRKALAAHLEAQVRAGMPPDRRGAV
ncbi:1-acyl-sn-glycerol-3-phosphate acyltransferase [Roseovarius sp. LXJ103]|uniref:lysophospholipid acyltransferase family protein n=1 Tax=Roseovarius carneus TaxID=2853164 RepID=UPI000D604013|nr:lysophospholipid acyltransferase family protein [Roseovarius carneus]MBZ8119190.1 1-acyl-sn-glycerol-3-phosphate acyltransferase [Roseovarius carneus]PWE35181.1 1-acyl-sn-glycerol-3-phosphate acyltransferase [Pelagicola sp. LXJ1103]